MALKFKNLSGGKVIVFKKKEGKYCPVEVDYGSEVSLTEEEVAYLKKQFKYSDWFSDGSLVKTKEEKEEKVTLNFLEKLAKAPMPEFLNGLKKIKSISALDELERLVTSKRKLDAVQKRKASFPSVSEAITQA